MSAKLFGKFRKFGIELVVRKSLPIYEINTFQKVRHYDSETGRWLPVQLEWKSLVRQRHVLNISAILAVLFSCITLFFYIRAKNNYRAVGFNDGRIQEKIDLVEKLERVNALHECDKTEEAQFTHFMQIKASDLYFRVNEDSRVFLI